MKIRIWNKLLLASMLIMALPSLEAAELKVGVVDFKKCVENSKLGKQEQDNFNKMKAQMESVLAEKEKVLTDLAQKLQDTDYLDSISELTETEMKRKFRTLSQEMSQHQQQYYQVLQQAHVKVIQGINEAIAEASKNLATSDKYDLIINDESAFFSSSALDVSDRVITEMDKVFSAKSSEETENALKGMFPGK
jgi:outer membrane protein